VAPGRGDQLLDAVGGSGVAGDGQAADLPGHGLGRRRVQVVDHHPGAVGGEPARDRPPDAAATAGDDHAGTCHSGTVHLGHDADVSAFVTVRPSAAPVMACGHGGAVTR
jgi:hypothetical protein